MRAPPLRVPVALALALLGTVPTATGTATPAHGRPAAGTAALPFTRPALVPVAATPAPPLSLPLSPPLSPPPAAGPAAPAPVPTRRLAAPARTTAVPSPAGTARTRPVPAGRVREILPAPRLGTPAVPVGRPGRAPVAGTALTPWALIYTGLAALLVAVTGLGVLARLRRRW